MISSTYKIANLSLLAENEKPLDLINVPLSEIKIEFIKY